jgi:hypothetical protein
MQMNEDTTNDENLGPINNMLADYEEAELVAARAQACGEVEAAQLEKQFLHPGYNWHGLPLRPYSAATEQLFKQVWDRNDAPETVFLEFVFIHTQDREKLKVLCWDKLLFRSALLDWLESLGTVTDEDNRAAMAFFEEVRNWARKSSVEVIPDPSLPEKKTTEMVQPLSPA